MLLLATLALTLLPPQESPAPEPLPGVHASYREADQHAIAPIRLLRLEGVRQHSDYRADIAIGPDGSVLKVRLQPGFRWKGEPDRSADVSAWLSAARFRPFLRDGVPTTVHFTLDIGVVPAEVTPPHTTDFPDLSRGPFTLSLTRTHCFGSCPAYTVSVDQTGLVTFNGIAYTAVTGIHHAQISREDLTDLVEAFRKTDFFSLPPAYRANVTDLPSTILSVTAPPLAERKLTDYAGTWVGIPQSVTDLEEAFDRITRSDRWVTAAAGLDEALAAEGFDFHSPQASTMLNWAASHGHAASVSGFLKRGTRPGQAPQDGVVAAAVSGGNSGVLKQLLGLKGYKPAAKDLTDALGRAAQDGRLDLMLLLLDAHADLNPTGAGIVPPLAYATGSCHPDGIRLLLAHGADLTAHAPNDQHSPILPTVGNMAYDSDPADCATAARLLLEAGADPNAADDRGNTLLHESGSAEVALALLKAGADPNRRNREGQTPLFVSFRPEVVRTLLAHGAAPRLHDSHGHNALEGRPYNNPEVESLLKAALAQSARD